MFWLSHLPEKLFLEIGVDTAFIRIKMIIFSEEPRNRLDIYTFLCRANSPAHDFKKEIKLEHMDGSEFDLQNCMWEESEKLIFIWTEHCGYFYFYKEDIRLLDIQEWQWNEKEDKSEIVEHIIMDFDFGD